MLIAENGFRMKSQPRMVYGIPRRLVWNPSHVPMSQFLFQYNAISPTSWVYLSSLLMIGLFFKFNRLWSMRNLDLLMLIALAPGLLLIHFGQVTRNAGDQHQAEPTTTEGEQLDSPDNSDTGKDPSDEVVATLAVPPDTEDGTGATPTAESDEASERAEKAGKFEYYGYMSLLAVGIFWLLRMLLDTRLTRRPLLSPNLSVGGMTWVGIALFVFLMANVVARTTPSPDVLTTFDDRMEQVFNYQQPDRGPGYATLNALPTSANKAVSVLSHLSIVLGIVLVAYRHFGNITNGIGAATLYLMLPYTSQMTGRVDHFLPAALLVWAIFFYRRPIIAGIFVGTAFGCVYYPLFLLPLWIGFYWHRGAIRFLIGVVVSLIALTALLSLAPGTDGFLSDLQRMFGWLRPAMEGLEGIWNEKIGGWDPLYRLPVLAACAVISCSMLLWPAQKNLATLISCSAAVMLISQFWHGFGGGLFIGWYLPLTLLMIFRPNLEDRVAQSMLNESRLKRRTTTATNSGT